MSSALSSVKTTRRHKEAPEDAPKVRVRAWLEWDDKAYIGPGRAALLEGVERHGSITKAALEMGVSYRTAWKWIRIMNRAARHPLVRAAPGGPGGGGAALTPTGKAVIEAYRRLTADVTAFVERVNSELEALFDADRSCHHSSR